MCKGMEVNGTLVPVIPKEYRSDEDFIGCYGIIYDCFGVECCDCLLRTPIKEKDVQLIDIEDKLVAVEIVKDFWVCLNATLDEINEIGEVGCINVMNCDRHEFECKDCIFNEYESLDLADVKYRIID